MNDEIGKIRKEALGLTSSISTWRKIALSLLIVDIIVLVATLAGVSMWNVAVAVPSTLGGIAVFLLLSHVVLGTIRSDIISEYLMRKLAEERDTFYDDTDLVEPAYEPSAPEVERSKDPADTTILPIVADTPQVLGPVDVKDNAEDKNILGKPSASSSPLFG